MHLLSRGIEFRCLVKKWWILLSISWITFPELLEHPDFNLAGITVLGNSPDNLDGYPGVIFGVDSLDNLPKRSLAE